MNNVAFADRLARELGPLASDAGWSTMPTEDQPYGHFTDAIEDSLGELDLSEAADATAAQLVKLRRIALLTCLSRLQIHYAAQVDSSGMGVGVADSQRVKQIELIRQHLSSRVAVGASLRGQPRRDYTLGGGNE